MLLILLTIFCVHLDAAQDWKWIRVLNSRGDVIAHFSSESISTKNQAATAGLFRLSTEDIHDLKNKRIPQSYTGCSLEYGSEFPPDDKKEWNNSDPDSDDDLDA